MKKKWYLFIIVAILLIIQLIRIDKTNPPVDIAKDFITVTNPPADIAKIIKTSCYDCHSNETVYPWYSNVAPVSWYLKNHINEARHRVNFSEWANYPVQKVSRKLEACAEDIEHGEMPLSSYNLIHTGSKLNQDQSKILSDWFKKESEKSKN
jgi:hypothetical protein